MHRRRRFFLVLGSSNATEKSLIVKIRDFLELWIEYYFKCYIAAEFSFFFEGFLTALSIAGYRLAESQLCRKDSHTF
jgi:hypothetical protein